MTLTAKLVLLLAATGLSWRQIDDDLSRLVAGGKILTLAAARLVARAVGGLSRGIMVRSAP